MEISSVVQKPASLREYLKSKHHLSSNLLLVLSRENLIFVDGKSRFLNFRLQPGMKVTIKLVYEDNTYEPCDGPLEVLYDDDQLLVVNKDAGVTIHPTAGTPAGTLLNLVSNYQKQRGENYRIRIINRLDRDTSGIVLIAKTKYMHHQMSELFIQRDMKKRYQAICHGNTPPEFSSDSPIEITEGISHRTGPEGKPSFTEFFLLEKLQDASYIEAWPHTGRTHQIRIHLAEAGFPIFGDTLYGILDAAPRQMLHCCSMSFLDPRDGTPREFRAPIKDDFKALLTELRIKEK